MFSVTPFKVAEVRSPVELFIVKPASLKCDDKNFDAF